MNYLPVANFRTMTLTFCGVPALTMLAGTFAFAQTSDAVRISAEFAQLPAPTNHVGRRSTARASSLR